MSHFATSVVFFSCRPTAWMTTMRNVCSISGAGTNLKVGLGAHTTEKFLLCPFTFLALQVGLVVLVSAFVMVSRPTVWSFSCLLFYSRCPRAQWRGRHCVGSNTKTRTMAQVMQCQQQQQMSGAAEWLWAWLRAMTVVRSQSESIAWLLHDARQSDTFATTTQPLNATHLATDWQLLRSTEHGISN